jgi:hypothetical protein
MLVCYIDEAGNNETLQEGVFHVQPVFVLGGVIIHQQCIHELTRELIDLKKRFYPNRNNTQEKLWHSWLQVEVKGSDLRKYVRDGDRDELRHAIGFLDKMVRILENNGAQIVARIYIKEVGRINSETAIYNSAVQRMADVFQHRLSSENTLGVIVADNRNNKANALLSYSVFTQKYSSAKKYGDLIDVPMFGQSTNHAGIQCADYLCSALLFPLAVYAYCKELRENIHVSAQYKILQQRFGQRLKKLQYRYRDDEGKSRGGIVVSDPVYKRCTTDLFGAIPL